MCNSVIIPDDLIVHNMISHSDFRILVFILSAIEDDPHCPYSIYEICELGGFGEVLVRGALVRLETLGLITLPLKQGKKKPGATPRIVKINDELFQLQQSHRK